MNLLYVTNGEEVGIFGMVLSGLFVIFTGRKKNGNFLLEVFLCCLPYRA